MLTPLFWTRFDSNRFAVSNLIPNRALPPLRPWGDVSQARRVLLTPQPPGGARLRGLQAEVLGGVRISVHHLPILPCMALR